MTTHFISAEIDLEESPTELQASIETELKKQGEPLRWAVTEVNADTAKAKVEAVVVTASKANSSIWLNVHLPLFY